MEDRVVPLMEVDALLTDASMKGAKPRDAAGHHCRRTGDKSLRGATIAGLTDEPTEVSMVADALKRGIVRACLSEQVHRE